MSSRSGPADIACAKRLQRIYVRRKEEFGRRLTSEVVWNMLLDLLVSESDGRGLSVTALAVGSHAPLSTALRYVESLREAGYLVRVADGDDGRRSQVRLTARGRQATFSILNA